MPSALDVLTLLERESGISQDSPAFAEWLDENDELAPLRQHFSVPRGIYFAAHALGAAPKATPELLLQEYDVWATVGTKGHTEHEYGRPWVDTDQRHSATMADIVGALPSEVAYASGLTTNLHVLLQAFYRPTRDRFKIIYEHDAFNSDRFAIQSQVRLAGHSPEKALLGVKQRQGETYLRTEDILDAIEQDGAETSVVLFGAVNWYSSQFLDMPKITAAARAKGCIVGWDIAHGVGNVPLKLHEWNVDFAVWCSYKYLCAGPGATAGFFIHDKHSSGGKLRCSGWWGNDLSTRFSTVPEFQQRAGAGGWTLSNPSVLGTVPLHASLAIYEQVVTLTNPASEEEENVEPHTAEHKGSEEVVRDQIMGPLRKKGQRLSAYLEHLLVAISARPAAPDGTEFYLKIVSPSDVNERGSTLSVEFHARSQDGQVLDQSSYSAVLLAVVNGLKKRGIPSDTRAPSLIRFGPSPLYNTFDEVRRLAAAVGAVLSGN